MSNFVRMFKPQFSPMVESGSKCQTVRPIPARMPKAGDTISLREWTGKPYNSKQRILRAAIISRVAMCEITWSGVYLDGQSQPREMFACADGFAGFDEMSDWFKEAHGLPFTGILIQWAAPTEC